MHRTKGSTKLTVTTALGALALALAAQAGSAAGDKVLICHGTASATNPYELNSISVNALDTHLYGPDGTEPGHGQKNAQDFLYDSSYPTCAAQAADGGTGGGQQ